MKPLKVLADHGVVSVLATLLGVEDVPLWQHPNSCDFVVGNRWKTMSLGSRMTPWLVGLDLLRGVDVVIGWFCVLASVIAEHATGPMPYSKKWQSPDTGAGDLPHAGLSLAGQWWLLHSNSSQLEPSA